MFVIIIVITVTPRFIVNGLWSIIISKLLDIDVLEEADYMVVFTGMLASVITMIIGPPITIISTVAIVVVVAPVMTFAVVVPTTVIGFIVPARWVLGA
jgi:hypothetical protein